jgi:hypothetical protein
MMKHQAEVAHHMPGRLRIRIPAARDNAALLESLKQVFVAVWGIDSVTVKLPSGSLVLHYNPRLEAEMEARFASYQNECIEMKRNRPGGEVKALAAKLGAGTESLAGHSAWARAVFGGFIQFDRQIRVATNNTIDVKIALVFGLAVATFLGIGAHASTPMWVTLAVFVLNDFMRLNLIAAPAAAVA